MKLNFTHVFLRSILVIFLVSFICFSSFAQTLKGKVTDAITGEALIGAHVLIKETKQNYFVELGGNFVVKEIKQGQYTLVISYIGYNTRIEPVTISAAGIKTIALPLSSNTKGLNVITVTESRASDAKEKSIERNAGQLLNVVSAKAIELSPDISVGNVLQRVSGVSVQRSSSGDGQYAIIRGLDSRYNYTSINGIILPSPDATQRSVPLDMFPSDMIKRIEIIKTLTPDVEANAIGGATNLIMKDGPDTLTVNANLSTGLSTVFSGRPFSGFSTSGINFKSPTEMYGSQYVAKVSDLKTSQLNFNNVKYPLNIVGGFSIGDRLFNHKLGYIIAGSYIREYRGGNTLFYAGQGANDNPPNTPAFSSVQQREYSFLQSRGGMQAKFDYAISPDHYFNLYGLFLQLDDNQHSHNMVSGLGGTGEIDYFDNAIFNRKNITNVAFSGHDKIVNKLSADYTLSYAEAKATTPDQVSLETYRETITSNTLYLSNLPSVWSHNSDMDKSAYLNLKYELTKNIEIAGGGLYRSKYRIGYYNDYLLSSAIPNAPKQQFTTVNNATFNFIPYPAAAQGDTTNENNYTAHEQVSAGYIETKMLLFNNLHVIAGVREETTDQNYTSQISPALPGKTGSFHYMDILPGLHLRYSLSDKENLRLSYFAGISRPTLYDLIPSSNSTDASALYTTSGNYNLKHSTADNIDFRYDNYFTSNNYVLVGAYYKRIANPIEYSTFTLNGTPVTASNVSVLYGPTNPGADAINYGVELVGSKFFGKFGISGNYSYTHSSVTTLKEILGNNNGSPVVTFVNQTRPLQGQADHIGNLSLLFKDGRSGLDVQLSGVYTGKRISVVSPFYELDTWQRANTQLDFSLNKRLSRQLSVFFKATNLLNTKLYQDILHSNSLINFPGGLPGQTNPNRILIQQDDFRQTFLMGLRYKIR
jgi:outer membrane cobalamin receptor